MPMAKFMAKDHVSGRMDVGAWVSGNMDSCLGWGAYFSKVIGEWVNGVCHGFGIFMTPDGFVRSGVWRQGKCVLYDSIL
jgi:hypothetical protein